MSKKFDTLIKEMHNLMLEKKIDKDLAFEIVVDENNMSGAVKSNLSRAWEKDLKNNPVPNALTVETLDKSDRGEDLRTFETVEELTENLNEPETEVDDEVAPANKDQPVKIVAPEVKGALKSEVLVESEDVVAETDSNNSEIAQMTFDSFLIGSEREEVKEAVEKAELQTAGEIKVLIVQNSRLKLFSLDIFRLLRRFNIRALRVGIDTFRNSDVAVSVRALFEFFKLGVHKTVGATGVLIMISLDERKVEIRADESINEVVRFDEGICLEKDKDVQPKIWGDASDLILKGIKSGNHAEGLCNAIKLITVPLAKHFPRKQNDRNELSDGVEFKN